MKFFSIHLRVAALAAIGLGAFSPASHAHDPAEHKASNAKLAAEAPGIDLTRLPLGDTRHADRPRAGWLWACGGGFAEGRGTPRNGPWIRNDGTYDFLNKAVVQGQVKWPSRFSITVEGDKRVFTSNDLPNHPTGTFPISPDDPAYAVDRNPNAILTQDMRIEVPLNPTLAPQPSCIPGVVGIMLTGVSLFDGFDAELRDAVAHEVQDSCQGHPQVAGAYHYHNLSSCLEDKPRADGHSALMAYAIDGFGIYGHRGVGGKVVTNGDLDECHGHTHEIEWNGRMMDMYHYHATWEFPYTAGCLRGKFDDTSMLVLSGAPRSVRENRARIVGAAEKLGISADRLRAALGPPPPDFARAAEKLGISEPALKQALQGWQPGQGGPSGQGRPPRPMGPPGGPMGGPGPMGPPR